MPALHPANISDQSGTFLPIFGCKAVTFGCVLHAGLPTALYIVWGADCIQQLNHIFSPYGLGLYVCICRLNFYSLLSQVYIYMVRYHVQRMYEVPLSSVQQSVGVGIGVKVTAGLCSSLHVWGATMIWARQLSLYLHGFNS